MFELEGKMYKKLALHGGGCPMFGHYVGLFESLKLFDDFERFNIPLVTSSAGSVAILYFLIKFLDKTADIQILFEKIYEECGNVLSNMDQTSVISYDFIDNIVKTKFKCVYNLTFSDLQKMNPNIDWTVCCSTYENFDFSLRTYGTKTPEVVVWRACVASMAVPIILPPVHINGCLVCDGDFSDWVRDLHMVDDTDFLHIGSRIYVNEIGFKVHTEIPLLDETIKFAIRCFKNMSTQTQPNHGVLRTSFTCALDKHFFSDEYIDSGKSMSKVFVLK